MSPHRLPGWQIAYNSVYGSANYQFTHLKAGATYAVYVTYYPFRDYRGSDCSLSVNDPLDITISSYGATSTHSHQVQEQVTGHVLHVGTIKATRGGSILVTIGGSVVHSVLAVPFEPMYFDHSPVDSDPLVTPATVSVSPAR